MWKFLREDSKVSSIRVSLFLGTICACLLMVGMLCYMVIHAYKCTTLDWSGMAIFLGGISAFTGTLLYGKVQQKKVETPTNTETETTTNN
jgi:hypothetical protein